MHAVSKIASKLNTSLNAFGGSTFLRKVFNTQTYRKFRFIGARVCCFRCYSQTPRPPPPPKPGILKSDSSPITVSSLDFTSYLFKNLKAEVMNKPFIICAQTGKTYTFGEVQELTFKVQSALVNLGFQDYDVLATVLPNLPQFSVVLFGVAALGAKLSPMDPSCSPIEIEHHLLINNAKYLVTLTSYLDKIKEVMPQTQVETVITLEEMGGVRTFGKLLRSQKMPLRSQARLIDPNRILFMPFTSGVLYSPVCLALTHQNAVANLQQMAHPDFLLPIFSEHNRILALIPFFHMSGLMMICSLAYAHQQTVITVPEIRPSEVMELIHKHRPNIIPMSAYIFRQLCRLPLIEKDMFSSVHTIIIGYSQLDPVLVDTFLEKIAPHKIDIITHYGVTSATAAAICTPYKKFRQGSSGKLMASTEAVVMELETWRPAGPEVPGELFLRGPQVTNKYFCPYDKWEKEIMDDSWLPTGDICSYSEDGYFSMIDNVKEIMYINGEMVSPSEIERCLCRHPEIRDAVVFRIRDQEEEHVPMAHVVLERGSKLTDKELLEYIGSSLPPVYHLLKKIKFVSSIPRNPTGRPVLRTLKADYNKKNIII